MIFVNFILIIFDVQFWRLFIVSSNQKRDDMTMKLREMEEVVHRTVRREMELGIKEWNIMIFHTTYLYIYS